MHNDTRRNFFRSVASVAGAGLALEAMQPTSALAQAAPHAPAGLGIFNVRDFQAQGDGVTKDTAAIQAAIDACSRAGGGLVYLPPGKYHSGTIVLKDHVTLHLAPTATLLGSRDRADYPPKPFPARDLDIGGFEVTALVFADGAQNIGLEGLGSIVGNGDSFPPVKKTPKTNLDLSSGARPRAVFLKNCRRVVLRDVHIHDSACWSLHVALCENVVIDGLDIFSQFFVQQDGIILDSSRNVRLSNCSINTVDDCLVFKSSFPQACENVTVTNCVLTGDSSAIKFGTQSLGGFRNFAIANCACHDCRLGGLKFETVDGGTLEDVTVSNIVMTNVTSPIFFRCGNRGHDFGFKEVERPRPIGVVRNVLVTGIQATLTTRKEWKRTDQMLYPVHKGCPMVIAGLPGHPVENVTLADINVAFPGGGTAEEAARTDIPEEEKRYPEQDMFGVVPAWGLYVRHAKGLFLNHVRLALMQPDLRPAFMADDVADLELNSFKAAATGAASLIRLISTRNALVQNSAPVGKVENFLSLEGAASSEIGLVANDLRSAAKPVQLGAGVPPKAVRQTANLEAQS